ncbi:MULTISPECIES: hypothetical protein [Veillonella]|uniref:hypothetical protein n=1 Tax=Veillonella TaxID=29465 RepID=UPI001D073075|nr:MULTISPECIES: hypothetical protein [Veillonella]MBS6122406.1 hypothetical protein [Veillonella sp.]MCB6515944.1 hypothetical protein [Veillonella atypica]MCG4863609.1 hypothetical protein [Veillonella atypica]MDU6632607.1 hypothetical protein [Veillonella sp.]
MFQRMCAVAMFVAALFISVIPNADARQDIYAFTYNGNNWYVDRDSIDRSKPDGLLHFTVYTMIGLRYDVASGSEYYNADVYYYDQKLSTEGGQLLYRNPGILAAARVARQQPDAPKQVPKPVVAQQTASQSIAAQTVAQSVAPMAPQPNIVKALSTPVQAPVPANGPVKVNTQIPIVLPTGPVKKVAAKTVMTLHNTSKQTTGTTSESDETEANRTRK